MGLCFLSGQCAYDPLLKCVSECVGSALKYPTQLQKPLTHSLCQINRKCPEEIKKVFANVFLSR